MAFKPSKLKVYDNCHLHNDALVTPDNIKKTEENVTQHLYVPYNKPFTERGQAGSEQNRLLHSPHIDAQQYCKDNLINVKICPQCKRKFNHAPMTTKVKTEVQAVQNNPENMLIHSSDLCPSCKKPFVCPVCSGEYRDLTDLEEHMVTHGSRILVSVCIVGNLLLIRRPLQNTNAQKEIRSLILALSVEKDSMM